jgi:hypothetical protein
MASLPCSAGGFYDEPMSGGGEDQVAERRLRVLGLRAAGLSDQQIADREAEQGLPRRSARQVAMDVTRALEAASKLPDSRKDLLVALELERLDRLVRSAQTILATASAPACAHCGRSADPELALKAQGRLIQFAERRSALLALDRKPGEGPAAESPIDELRKRRDGKMRREA